MLNPDDFIYIDDSSFRIGIDGIELQNIVSSLPPGKIRKEFVEASTPANEHIITPFYISKKLVTVADYREFINATSYVTEAENDGWGWIWERGWKKKDGISWKRPFGDSSDDEYLGEPALFPVMQVSWNDATAFTKWKSSVEGIIVRLPSEIEWELFASKSGIPSIAEPMTDFRFLINDSKDFIKLLRTKIEESESGPGLLWEWTDDWYKGYSSDTAIKGFGEVYKVLRGGSLLSEEIQKRREFRFRRCPTARSPYYGFRIVFLNL